MNGDFQLTKFVSNNREISKTFSQSKISASCSSNGLDLEQISIKKALGLSWDPRIDILQIKNVQKTGKKGNIKS